MVHNGENSVFLRVIPAPYWIIVGFEPFLSRNNRELMRNNAEKRAILRLKLSISPKEWLFLPSFIFPSVSHVSDSFDGFRPVLL